MERAGAEAGPQSLGWTERAESSGREFPALGTVEVSDAPPGQHMDRGLVHGGVDLLPHALGDGRRFAALQKVRHHDRFLSDPIPAIRGGAGASAPFLASSIARMGRSV